MLGDVSRLRTQLVLCFKAWNLFTVFVDVYIFGRV
jgi:hypothetical protein